MDVERVEAAAAGGEVPPAPVVPEQPQPEVAEPPPFPPTRRAPSLGAPGPDGYYGSGW